MSVYPRIKALRDRREALVAEGDRLIATGHQEQTDEDRIVAIRAELDAIEVERSALEDQLGAVRTRELSAAAEVNITAALRRVPSENTPADPAVDAKAGWDKAVAKVNERVGK